MEKNIKTIIAGFLLLNVCQMVDAREQSVENGRDILLEGKAAVFIPNDTFKQIYNNCPDFGLELTGRLFEQAYAFGSIDFIRKDGTTIDFKSDTQLSMVNLGLGLKYFVPFPHGDFYAGLGVAPTFLSTTDYTPELLTQNVWNCGGIAKLGFIFDLPAGMIMDFFFDYSFVKSNSYSDVLQENVRTDLNGWVIGLGFGYRFN